MQTSTSTTPPIQTSVHTPPHIPMLGNIPKLPSGSATPAAFPGKDEQDFDLGNAETVRMPHSRIGPTPTVNTLDQQKQRDLESELAQKQRAADFFSAWYEKNEEKIIAAYEEILRERDQETLAHLDPTDRQTIERMLQRRKALTKFNAVLQQGANPAALLRAYHAIKQT